MFRVASREMHCDLVYSQGQLRLKIPTQVWSIEFYVGIVGIASIIKSKYLLIYQSTYCHIFKFKVS